MLAAIVVRAFRLHIMERPIYCTNDHKDGELHPMIRLAVLSRPPADAPNHLLDMS